MESAGAGSAPARKASTTLSTSPATKPMTLTPRIIRSWCNGSEMAPQIKVSIPSSCRRSIFAAVVGLSISSQQRATTAPFSMLRTSASRLTSNTGEMRPSQTVKAAFIARAPL